MGGGTAFWSQDARGHRVEGPTIIVKPLSPGTAILFGGSVTHAGLSVLQGTGVAFVASFSSHRLRRGETVPMQLRDIYGDAILRAVCSMNVYNHK